MIQCPFLVSIRHKLSKERRVVPAPGPRRLGGWLHGGLLLVVPLLVLWGALESRQASAQRSHEGPTVYEAPGPRTGAQFGSAVAGVGDVDGDGHTDLIVGASRAEVRGTGAAGRAYLLSGTDGEVLHKFVPPQPRPRGFFGYSVTGVGDVTGDGTPDVAVGAAGDSSYVGRVHLFSGASGDRIRRLTSPQPLARGFFARSMAGVGDVNGDGTPDLLVGAIGENRAYLFSGADGALLHSLVSSADHDDHFGHVAVPGDVTGDAVPDLLIGASTATVADSTGAGRAVLYDGRDATRLRTLTEPEMTANGHFGYLVAGAGDVDGDGAPDVAVGASRGPDGDAPVYVFSGATGEVVRTLTPPSPESDGFFGYEAAPADDVNDDGVPDLAVGTEIPVSERNPVGRVYLFSGASGTRLQMLTPPSGQTGGRFGGTVARMGVNRAGLLVGAPEAQVDSVAEAGRVYRIRLRAK